MTVQKKVKDIIQISPGDLKPHPQNVKIYGAEDVKELSEQIEKSKWVKPLTVTTDFVIVSGHRRHAAATLLDMDAVPCEVVDFAHEWQVMERLLLENEYREKSTVQRLREFEMWMDVEQEKARGRQSELNGKVQLQENFPEASTGQARDKAAEKTKVGSGRGAENGLKAVKKSDELRAQGETEKADLITAAVNNSKNGSNSNELLRFIDGLEREDAGRFASDLKEGKKTVSQVKRIIENEQRRNTISERFDDAPELPGEKKYRVIYADPPWMYDKGKELSDKYGDVKKHYPPMETDDICRLPVSDLCADDCVLFLWATAPKLPEALDVIKAWGFQYKTCVVWDKVGHNFGYYFSVRHELLLIAGKGSSTPDVRKLHDSVISIEKSRKHSEKPEYFRELIDGMYTSGNKIELFARAAAEGWDKWGNEA